MAIPIKNNKVLTPAGNHIARIYQVIHLGTIDGNFGPKDTVRIVFELPKVTREFQEGEGERPFSIGKNYTISNHEKAGLRKVTDAIVGTVASGYDLAQLIGGVCLVNVVHKQSTDQTYANIDTVSPVPNGYDVPKAVNTPLVFDFSDNYSQEVLENMPDFIKEQIKKTPEYAHLNEDFNDVPFD